MDLWSPLPRSIGATLRDSGHPKPRVRLSAVADLVRWAQTDERAACVERLITLLEGDTDVEVRAAAALGLADVEAREALPALLRAVAAGPPRVVQLSLIALGELGEADADALAAVCSRLGSDAPALRFQALVAAGRLMPPGELRARLVEALADTESKLRYIACRIVEERFFSVAGADDAVLAELEGTLEPLLSDPELDVRVAVAVLLAPRGSKVARALLVSALNGRRRFAQLDDEQAAIELCAELGLDAARPGLTSRAFGGGWFGASPLAFQARVALARLGDERAKQAILRGLSSFRRNVRAQSVAAAGLARLEAARPRLLEMRREPSGIDSRSVIEALAALDR